MAAFLPRTRDQGKLSADSSLRSIVESLAAHPGYGICELDIDELAKETGNRAWVEAAPGRNPTHVSIHGRDDPEVAALVAMVARMVPGYLPTRPPRGTP